MGWKCLYAPYAKGYHVRKALPGNRRELTAEINMHSVKNRFLLRRQERDTGFPSPRATSWWGRVRCGAQPQSVLVSGPQI